MATTTDNADKTPDELAREAELDHGCVVPDDWTLLRRINWVRHRVKRLGKDATVTGMGGGYRAITHDKVTAELRPLLVQAGIVYWPTCESVADVDTGARTQKGRIIMQHQAVYQVRFNAITHRDDAITIRVPAYADDFGDKGPGKGASYATKYALLKLFAIETGEEDEARIEEAAVISTVGEDPAAQADLYAKADELFGVDAIKVLQSLAMRRFHQDDWRDIPLSRLADALRSLQGKYDKERDDGKEPAADPGRKVERGL